MFSYELKLLIVVLHEPSKSMLKKSKANVIATNQRNTGLKRYPVHSGKNGHKKVDTYFYEISPGIHLAYVSLAKCASNNVRHVLSELADGQHRIERNIKTLDDLGQMPKATYFSFIRNPWARLHSSFNMAMNGTSVDFPCEFNEFAKNPDISKVINIDPGHWTPQYNQLITEDGHFIPEYLCRIENFNKGMIKVVEIAMNNCNNLIKINNVINELNTLLNRRIKHHRLADLNNIDKYHRKYYNDDTMASAKEYYKEDIKLFGYQF